MRPASYAEVRHRFPGVCQQKARSPARRRSAAAKHALRQTGRASHCAAICRTRSASRQIEATRSNCYSQVAVSRTWKLSELKRMDLRRGCIDSAGSDGNISRPRSKLGVKCPAIGVGASCEDGKERFRRLARLCVLLRQDILRKQKHLFRGDTERGALKRSN